MMPSPSWLYEPLGDQPGSKERDVVETDGVVTKGRKGMISPALVAMRCQFENVFDYVLQMCG